MREAIEKAARGLRAGADLYRKLGRIERVAIALVAVVFCVACVAVVWPRSSSAHVAVVVGGAGVDSSDLERAASSLDAARIEWSEGRSASGERTIEVPAASAAAALRVLRGEGELAGADPSNEAQGAASFLETPDRFEARLRETNRRKIERTILWNDNLQRVSLILHNKGRRGLIVGGRDGGDSATVTLELKPHVARLKPGEVQAIRDRVRCAFGIQPELVSISDNHDYLYPPPLSAGASWVADQEDRLRDQVREEIRRLYAVLFDESEFQIGVIATLSPQRSTVERKEMRREDTFVKPTLVELERTGSEEPGGLLTSASGPIKVREQTTYTPFDSYEKTTTDIPPGELKGVSVAVHFDLDAVERVVTARRDLALPLAVSEGAGVAATQGASAQRDLLIQSFAERQEAAIQGLLASHGSVHVTATVHRFRKAAPATFPVDGQQIAGMTPEISSTGVAAWIGRWIGPLLVGVIAGALLLAGVRSLRPRLGGKATAGAWNGAPRSGAVDLEPLEVDGSAPWSPQAGPDRWPGVLRTVEEMSAAVRERPEAAAAVLRLWLAQDEPRREEVARS